jgi:hypothetical protein
MDQKRRTTAGMPVKNFIRSVAGAFTIAGLVTSGDGSLPTYGQ